MKMLLISSEFPPGPGGIGRHAHQLAMGFKALGWDVNVLGLQDYVDEVAIKKFNQDQSFKMTRFHERKWGELNFIRRLAQIQHVTKTFNPDIVVISGLRMVWLTAMLNLPSRLPCIAIGHGFEFGIKGAFLQWVTKIAYEKMTTVICVSHYTKQRMLDRGIKPKDTMVIPNGADSSVFKQIATDKLLALKEKLKVSQGPNLLSVGRVCQRKGQDLVIQALPLVLEKYPNVQYRIIGLPAEKEMFVEIAETLEVQDNVHFLGTLTDQEVMEHMNATDLFLMTSRHSDEGDFEGYGIAILEAALCGRAAIATGDSGLTEAVLNGQTGVVVPDHDPEAIAKAICELIADDEKRKAMGEHAQNRVLAENTWDHIVKRYDAHIRKFI